MAGVKPGEVLLINATVGGMPVYTGVRVIYADDESFTVMTPEGHPESGWNTFSAYVDDGTTVAQIQSLAPTTRSTSSASASSVRRSRRGSGRTSSSPWLPTLV